MINGKNILSLTLSSALISCLAVTAKGEDDVRYRNMEDHGDQLLPFDRLHVCGLARMGSEHLYNVIKDLAPSRYIVTFGAKAAPDHDQAEETTYVFVGSLSNSSYIIEAQNSCGPGIELFRERIDYLDNLPDLPGLITEENYCHWTSNDNSYNLSSVLSVTDQLDDYRCSENALFTLFSDLPDVTFSDVTNNIELYREMITN